jgi:hypothetical protein
MKNGPPSSHLPPSMHSTGEMVQWVMEGEPFRIDGAVLRRAVLKLAVACLLKPAYPVAGSRHEAALVLGGVLARAGWGGADIEHLVEVLARTCRDDDVRDRVVAAISALDAKANGLDIAGLPRLGEVWGDDVAKVLAYWLNSRTPRTVNGRTAGLEDAVALQFAAQHADAYRYIAESARWMQWTAMRWQPEKTLAAFDAARALCRTAQNADAKVVAAVERLARSDRRLAATVEQWDAEPEIFGAETMTIELRTGIDRPPSSEDYCSKIAGANVAPAGATCDLWLRFLDRVTNKDDELIGFLQRWLGYCLTGNVNEQVLVFLYGTGANGKGVFTSTVAGIFNDYCVTAPMRCSSSRVLSGIRLRLRG